MLYGTDNQLLGLDREQYSKKARYPEFDRTQLKVESLSKRQDMLFLSNILPLKPQKKIQAEFHKIAAKMRAAIITDSSIILMMGAHVIRSGVQRYIINLMEKGYISCVAMNGAGMIHDFEFAMQGSTTESVAENIGNGQFGLWQETSRINEIVSKAGREGAGLGEAVGQAICEDDFPYQDISILAAGYRMNIPVTVHVGIGYDIVHELPNCNGAAYGETSYRDFLRFANILESIQGGVVMNFGSAVMAPEIYLKALSMIRNVAKQENRKITQFTTLVCDLVKLPEKCYDEPHPSEPLYYFRPWKTMLVRTVAGGGESHYVCGRHADTIPQLWTAALQESE